MKTLLDEGAIGRLPLIQRLGFVCDVFNCKTASVDDDGRVWIEDPQAGHWLNDAEIEQLNNFLSSFNGFLESLGR